MESGGTGMILPPPAGGGRWGEACVKPQRCGPGQALPSPASGGGKSSYEQRLPLPQAAGRSARQELLDLGGDGAVGRLDRGGPGAGELAVGRDQVFVEVPARRRALAQLGGNPAEEGVRAAADHLLL